MLIGEEPAYLAVVPEPRLPITLRNTYIEGPDTVVYEEGRDYVLDRKAGTIRRTATSRMPDFRKNILYGQEDFDHSKFPGFGNKDHFVYIDYTPSISSPWPKQERQFSYLPKTRKKLQNGDRVRIVAYGDSITAGGDATKPELIFWQRWASALQGKYHNAEITIANGATGGDSTVQGMSRLKEKVLDEHPDLVIIGFGMNDHNINSVPVDQFALNLMEIIGDIRANTQAEIILFSAFPPNPKWKFGTHHMQDYAEATRMVAKDVGCAYADVFNNWQTVAQRKKPEDLLGNNINHPNDYGHWIYFQVLSAISL
ncbi:MAG: SGNH/GDSL hydrolase family protein [Candidatus Hydrogenedentes bacterium]|nr:SGNH/GDSL hydrolase family protein [Candidatus Hydrogenedentota bacterium]